MKRFFVGMCTFIMVLSFAGCSVNSKKDWDKKKIVDDVANTVLEYDSDSKDYDDALEVVSQYILGDVTKEYAQSTLQSTIDKMQDDYSNVKYKEISDEFAKLLDDNLVPSGEYVMYINARADKLTGYINSLESLKYYVDGDINSKITKEDLAFTYNNDINIQKSERKYEFYSINYFFGEWSESDIEYLDNTVLIRLKSFNIDKPKWVFGRDTAEKEFTRALDEMQLYIEKSESHIAESKEELDKLQHENKSKN